MRQFDSESVFVTLELHLITLLSKFFCLATFFGTGRNGRDGVGWTERYRDRQIFLGKYCFGYLSLESALIVILKGYQYKKSKIAQKNRI